MLSILRNFLACNFNKNETPPQVFSCEFCKIFKNTCFVNPLWKIYCLLKWKIKKSQRKLILKNVFVSFHIFNEYFSKVILLLYQHAQIQNTVFLKHTTSSPEQLLKDSTTPHDFAVNFYLIWFVICKTIEINLDNVVNFP